MNGDEEESDKQTSASITSGEERREKAKAAFKATPRNDLFEMVGLGHDTRPEEKALIELADSTGNLRKNFGETEGVYADIFIRWEPVEDCSGRKEMRRCMYSGWNNRFYSLV